MIEIKLQFPDYYTLTNEEKAIIDSIMLNNQGEGVPTFELLGSIYEAKLFSRIDNPENPELRLEITAIRSTPLSG